MTLAELLTEVYELTNRSDLVSLTTSAVKAATLKAHRLDFFDRDVFETGVEFTTSGYTQSLDYMELINNWRAPKYLKRVESSSDTEGKFLHPVSVESILDRYGNNKTDIYYSAGRVIEIRSSVEFKYLLLGAYVSPIVTDADFSSWVAILHPYAIIYEAARVVFTSTGQNEEAARFKKLLKRTNDKEDPGEYDMLISEALTVQGH